MTLSSRKTTYRISFSNTEHKRYLLLLIGIYAPSLASSRETVLSVAHSTTSYYDNSHYVNDLENPDSDGSRGGSRGGRGAADSIFSTKTRNNSSRRYYYCF